MSMKKRLDLLATAQEAQQARCGVSLEGLSLEEMRVLYDGWAHDPTPRPDLDALSLAELTALYLQTIRGTT